MEHLFRVWKNSRLFCQIQFTERRRTPCIFVEPRDLQVPRERPAFARTNFSHCGWIALCDYLREPPVGAFSILHRLTSLQAAFQPMIHAVDVNTLIQS
jgi:hypothetical protein